MTEPNKDKLRRIIRSMERWDGWWWWNIMRNYSEVQEIRAAIRSWKEQLEELVR